MTEENINSLTEIKSLKKKIEELKEKKENLEKLQNTQGDLFKMLIHDLKGPVGEITANLDLLNCEKSLSEINREYVETAMMGCENLYRMILNILEISKMEEGCMSLNKKTFQMDEIIQERMKKLKAVLNQNEICVTMKIDEELQPVNADWEIIDRVLSNLLLNAISYSPQKSEIKIVVEPNGEKDFLRVKITDQGKGIPINPRSAAFFNNSSGIAFSLSILAAMGLTSWSTNFLTISRNMLCSSLNLKSIIPSRPQVFIDSEKIRTQFYSIEISIFFVPNKLNK